MKKKPFVFIFIHIFLINILLLVLLLFYASNYYKNHVSLTKKSIEQTNRSLAEQINLSIESLDYIALNVVSDPTITSILKTVYNASSFDNENFYNTNVSTSNALSSLINATLYNPKSTSARITIFDTKNNVLHTTLNSKLYVASQQTICPEILEDIIYKLEDQYVLIIPSHQDYWSTSDITLCSIIRPIVDVSSNITYGYVEIQQDISSIYECLVHLDENEIAYIADRTGRIIFPTEISDQNIQHKLDNAKHTVVSSSELACGLSLYLFHNNKQFLMQTIFYLIFVAMLIILLIFFLSKSIISYSRQILQPIQKTQKLLELVQLNHIEEFQIDVNIPVLENLINSFSDAFLRLQKNAKEIENLQELEFKAQLNAIKAQVTPHFLYNTLSVINAEAIDIENEKISKMCICLSNMLKYSSRKNIFEISLLEELTNLNHYFYLMEQRFEDNLQVYVDTQIPKEQMQSIKVPIMSIQPLVENCFKHGFLDNSKTWMVHVRIYAADKKWFFELNDNGIGISPKKKKELITILSEKHLNARTLSQANVEGLGLISTISRLWFIYKKDTFWDIEESSLGGAQITIGGKMYV